MSESILKKSGNRMQIIIYLAIAIAALLIQSSLIDLMAIRGIKPDLLLIFLVIISKREGRFWGTTSGFGIGLLQDIFETQFLGLSSLCKSIAGFVAAWLEAKQPQQRILVWGTFLFIIGLLHNLIFYSIRLVGSGHGFFKIIFRYILPETLYTCVLGIIIFSLIPQKWLMRTRNE